MRTSSALLLIWLLFGPTLASAGAPKTDVDFRRVSIELDRQAAPSENTLVVNKKCGFGSSGEFAKFALFAFDREPYVESLAVTHGGERLTLGHEDLQYRYLYDVYTYWYESELLVVCFRIHLPGPGSKYQYFRRDNGQWSPVLGAAYSANSRGLIPPAKLLELLRSVKQSNAKGAHGKSPNDSKSKTGDFIFIFTVSAFFTGVALYLMALIYFTLR